MSKREVSIDRLRIVATVLVVLHHTAIIYGGSGDWIYKEESTELASVILTLFTALNQSFFMGIFFLFGGYFTLKSIQKHGALKFIKSRLLRLGIPLLGYYFFLSPLFIYLYKYNTGMDTQADSVFQFLLNCWSTGSMLSPGPLWFVQALLLFSFLFLPVCYAFPSLFKKSKTKMPPNRTILLVLLAAGILTFLVRLIFPVGVWKLHFQLAHFVQYILLFIVGIAAARGSLLTAIPQQSGRFFSILSLTLITLLPLLLLFSIFISGGDDLSPFMGTLTWQSGLFSLWEQITGGSIIIALLYCSGKIKREETLLHNFLSKGAYTVYIIHTGVLIQISLLMKDVSLHPLLKFFLAGSLSTLACFSLAWPIRQVPGLRRIL